MLWPPIHCGCSALAVIGMLDMDLLYFQRGKASSIESQNRCVSIIASKVMIVAAEGATTSSVHPSRGGFGKQLACWSSMTTGSLCAWFLWPRSASNPVFDCLDSYGSRGF